MAQALARSGAGVPFTARLFAAWPAPPLFTGAAVLAAFLCVFALFCALTGQPFVARLFEYELLHGAFLAYTCLAAAYALRGAARDLRDLRPVLRGSDAEHEARARYTLAFPRAHLLAAGAFGITVGALVAVSPGAWDRPGPPPFPDPVFLWVVAKIELLFWLVCRTAYLDIALAVRFSRLGERELWPVLPRPEALAPFARHGLRSVLIWMGFSVLVGFLFLQPYGRAVATPNLVATLAIAIAALLLPLGGVHRRLRAAKRAELERVDAAIDRDRDALLAGAPESRLAHLVAYRGLVDALPTWPLDLSVWLRFALYVALGGGSWIGAALVERLLDRALSG